MVMPGYTKVDAVLPTALVQQTLTSTEAGDVQAFASVELKGLCRVYAPTTNTGKVFLGRVGSTPAGGFAASESGIPIAAGGLEVCPEVDDADQLQVWFEDDNDKIVLIGS